MDPMSASTNPAIAFVRIGSFSHINESLRSELARQLPGYDIDDVDVASLVSKVDRWGWPNLAQLAADQRWQLLAPLHRIQEVVAKTDYVFRLSSERIRRRLSARRYAFTLQTSSLFDASQTGTPHFIFTDHTALANLQYAPADRPILPVESWLRLEGELYRKATGIFTMGRFSAESLIHDYGCRPQAVMCVDSGSNVPPPPASITDARYAARHILFVGVEWERKGGPDLVEAVRCLRADGVPARLTVIGCSPKISERWCEVLGRIPPADLPRHYAQASLLCVPSRREPAGIVFTEAGLYGLASVSTTVGGIPERVLHGATGLLVPPGDPPALAAALRHLLEAPARCRRMGARARIYAGRAFTWERTVSLMRERIFRTVGQAA
jgi:glycosyltransferase involved in cell wall biosynthesis